MTATSRFLLLGEPLALDLVNTRIRRDGADVDLLGESAALTAWLQAEHDRLSWGGTANVADLTAVRALRDAIDGLFCALRERQQPPIAALNEVNDVLSNPGSQPRLAWAKTGPHLIPPPAPSKRATLLRTLAIDAVGVLTGPQAHRLRQCAHPECRLQFVATNARRRWCSGALCGNRARVARHYRRQRKTR